jgi:hypothetical protein
MVITPKKKQVPINRRIPNQASLHNPAPNTSAKTAFEENMLTTLTTKNITIGRVSTVPVTVDTRPISHMSF